MENLPVLYPRWQRSFVPSFGGASNPLAPVAAYSDLVDQFCVRVGEHDQRCQTNRDVQGAVLAAGGLLLAALLFAAGVKVLRNALDG